jgi:hypothetical protein
VNLDTNTEKVFVLADLLSWTNVPGWLMSSAPPKSERHTLILDAVKSVHSKLAPGMLHSVCVCVCMCVCVFVCV